MSDYKLRVRNPKNDGWINILKDVNIEVVDENGDFVNNSLDQVLIELLNMIRNSEDIHGGVFFTDVVPTSSGFVGNKVYSSPENYDLVSCSVSTFDITCKLRGITGWTNYKPVITINDVPVDISIQEDNPLWDGTIDITLTEPVTVLKAIHEDGAYDEITVTYEAPPVATTVEFVGDYPIGRTSVMQTELKEDDTFDIHVVTDIPINKIIVLDQDACKYQEYNFAEATDVTITSIIADRGNVATPYNGHIIAVAPNGFESEITPTSNTVILNNIRPSVIIDDKIYPIDPTYSLQQEALKDNEQVEVHMTFSDTTSHQITFPFIQLALITPYDGDKIVLARDSGGYNITLDNFVVEMYRVENDTVAEHSDIIFIANTPQIIDISIDPERLVSGGNNGTIPPDNTVTITSDQNLLQAPTMDNPIGTWQGTDFEGGPEVWTRIIHVHDDETKGTYQWLNLETFNLAAIRVDTINTGEQFEVGGFVAREFYIDPWPNRQGDIGTVVTDTTKLICTNYSKGLDEGNFEYQPTTTNAVDRYTIINDDIWYNCDLNNSVSNTTGEMVIRLEEEP